MNPYTPYDLLESSRQARAALEHLDREQMIALMKQIGMLDAEGRIQPAFDWRVTPEEEIEYLAGKHSDPTG